MSSPLAVCLLLTGCGYMIGSPYQAEVRTVHVPIFTSDSFRRGIEYQLTEAVQKEIQTRTPFRLAKGPQADTQLRGRIVEIRKGVLGETADDDPRQLELSLTIEVTWEDLRSGQVLQQRQITIAPDMVPLIGQAAFAPEVGQSLATANQQVVSNLAQQIVDMMEMPW